MKKKSVVQITHYGKKLCWKTIETTYLTRSKQFKRAKQKAGKTLVKFKIDRVLANRRKKEGRRRRRRKGVYPVSGVVDVVKERKRKLGFNREKRKLCQQLLGLSSFCFAHAESINQSASSYCSKLLKIVQFKFKGHTKVTQSLSILLKGILTIK